MTGNLSIIPGCPAGLDSRVATLRATGRIGGGSPPGPPDPIPPPEDIWQYINVAGAGSEALNGVYALVEAGVWQHESVPEATLVWVTTGPATGRLVLIYESVVFYSSATIAAAEPVDFDELEWEVGPGGEEPAPGVEEDFLHRKLHDAAGLEWDITGVVGDTHPFDLEDSAGLEWTILGGVWEPIDLADSAGLEWFITGSVTDP